MPLARQIDEKFTYADYLGWGDEERWELIAGTAYNMSPAPSRIHQDVSMNLSILFSVYLKEKNCKVYAAPFDVRLTHDLNMSDREIENVVQPDISIICTPEMLDERGCKGVPDLIVEILSPSTAGKDIKEKFSLYEKFGVKEYWVVYPHETIVEIFSINENGLYSRPKMFSREDTISVEMLGELEIDLSKVFE